MGRTKRSVQLRVVAVNLELENGLGVASGLLFSFPTARLEARGSECSTKVTLKASDKERIGWLTDQEFYY